MGLRGEEWRIGGNRLDLNLKKGTRGGGWD